MKGDRKFEYIDHTADLGFKAYGASLETLFANAAEAFFEVMVSVKTIEIRQEKAVEVTAPGLDGLLVSWLNELLFLFDTEGLLCRKYEISHLEDCTLRATVLGESMDPERHEMKTGIKAATYHQLYVRQTNGSWECQVILDL